MKKFLKYILVGLVIIGVAAGLFIYTMYLGPAGGLSNQEPRLVRIPTNSSYEEVVDILKAQNLIKDEMAFGWMADYMKYKKDPMRPGQYEIQPGWNMIRMIRHLRAGGQAPVDVILTNERLIENVAAKAARFLEADSMAFLEVFNDTDYLNEIGYTTESLMSVFIPNTYEMFWTSTPRQFLERMVKEHDAFWSQNGRLEKAKSLGLNQNEVYSLASIVEKETLVASEKTRMAGVYINRLELGMRLQADPTAVFATRDFDTPRVTDYHTLFDSPYNTYRYKGLPPGPISMASIGSIDAVLNAEDHNYVYFCAVGDGSGLHAFAETLQGHNQNAARYRENLVKRGLR